MSDATRGQDQTTPKAARTEPPEPAPPRLQTRERESLKSLLARLTEAVRRTDPGALLVPSRILRRVITMDRDLRGLLIAPPHRKSYVVSRARFRQFVEPEDLARPDFERLPETLCLIELPRPEKAAAIGFARCLVRSWRLLFHARIHEALDQRVAQRHLDQAQVRERIDRIGQIQFDEIRAVLRHENFLLPPVNDQSVYVEFAALHSELAFFDPALLSRYFPSISDHEAITRLLEQDVSLRSLFDATRPEGAPAPQAPEVAPPDDSGPRAALPATPRVRATEATLGRLLRRADRNASLGNAVRAAILRLQASKRGASEEVAHAAHRDLLHLLNRMTGPLELGEDELTEWKTLLAPLLELSIQGIRSPEARLLYDLQRICVDHERGIFGSNLFGWLRSFGRQPLRHELPDQTLIHTSRLLHRALRRLGAMRLTSSERRRLRGLLKAAIARADKRTKERFRPLIEAALDEAGLVAQNVPERVARARLVSELLDKLLESGFFAMTHVRDALSRSQIKLADCEGVDDVWKDRLLAADRVLHRDLRGVYRRGEIYLRGLQRLSLVSFGTEIGRKIVRYLVLPFGGAFVALEGLQHLVGAIAANLFGAHPQVNTPLTFFLTGFLFLGLLHLEGFGRGLWQAIRLSFSVIRDLVVGLWDGLMSVLFIRRFLRSQAWFLIRTLFFKPALWTTLVWVSVAALSSDHRLPWYATAAVFLGFNLALNSRLGRNAEEVAVEGVGRSWNQFRARIILGLFHLVMSWFERLLDAVERFLYAVDEKLRFRREETRTGLVLKAVLNAVWAFFRYLIRIYVTLLVEPQINPIKHFPVVTVSHKIILPLTPQLTALFAAPIAFLGPWLANGLALGTVVLLPGVFGFLVWEFKENWKLFAANRAPRLKPVIIGHHGERMIQFMRPGFHSGTLPKLFARLRRSDRKNRWTGELKASRKHQEGIHRVEEAIRHFVERELFAVLRESDSFRDVELEMGVIEVGSNSIRIELRARTWPDAPGATLAFEEQSGWLVASFRGPGWVERLDVSQRDALSNAIAGLYHLAGVQLVREQIEAALAAERSGYDISDAGLVVWPGEDYETEVTYGLDSSDTLVPRSPGRSRFLALRPIPRDQILFRETPVAWHTWVETWDSDAGGQGHPRRLAQAPGVLPTGD